MTMPIEEAARLRLKEIINDSAVKVSAFEPEGAERDTVVWFEFQHSTTGENIDSGTPAVSYAVVNIFIGAPESLPVVTVARKIRLGLYGTDPDYWPTTGTRRRVRSCTAAAGGEQGRTAQPAIYLERMSLSLCFDDTDEGVLTD